MIDPLSVGGMCVLVGGSTLYYYVLSKNTCQVSKNQHNKKQSGAYIIIRLPWEPFT